MNGEDIPHLGQADDPVNRRRRGDQAYRPAAQLGASPGQQERAQASAIHE
jgi:hypothetical protein